MRKLRATLFVVALAAVAAAAPGFASRTAETPRQIIDITAERFAFTPSEVKVKADYSVVRNRSTVLAAPNSFNLGLGWWF